MLFIYFIYNLDIFNRGVILGFLSLSVILDFNFLSNLTDTNDVID